MTENQVPASFPVALMTVEQVSADIEEPFELAPDDLPLERLCETIKASVRQVLPKGDPG